MEIEQIFSGYMSSTANRFNSHIFNLVGSREQIALDGVGYETSTNTTVYLIDDSYYVPRITIDNYNMTAKLERIEKEKITLW
jgi:hypothetical protein